MGRRKRERGSWKPVIAAGPCRVILASLGAGQQAGALKLATALACTPIDAVYRCGSPETREVFGLLGLPTDVCVLEEPRLRESDGDAAASASGAQQRAFCELVGAHQGRTVVLLCGASVIQALLRYVLNVNTVSPERFACNAMALTVVEVGADSRGVLRALNANTPPSSDPHEDVTRVVLLRHGHAMNVEAGGSVYSHNPIPLSEHGRAQAERAAVALRSIGPALIYSSDIVRARQTADVCARALGLEVIVDEALRELAIGDFEGTTLERVRAEHAAFLPWLEVTFRERFPTVDFHHPADLRFPHGQSVLEVHERSLAAFLRIVRAERGRTVALVSHGWVLQPLLCHIVGADPRDYFRFSLPTATLAVADVDNGGRGVLRMFNGGVGLADLPKLVDPSEVA